MPPFLVEREHRRAGRTGRPGSPSRRWSRGCRWRSSSWTVIGPKLAVDDAQPETSRIMIVKTSLLTAPAVTVSC